MKTRLLLSALVGAFAVSAPAQAQDMGWSSQASMSVTVEILPVGAAMAAAEAGATGLWTMSGRNRGLMVNLPKTIKTGQSRQVTLYSTQAVPLVVSSDDLDVSRTGTSDDRGLKNSVFSINARSQTTLNRPARVLITTL